MASSAGSTFLLSAADVSWGRRQCYTVALATGNFTAGQYFTVHVPTSQFGPEAGFYVWADDGVAADPAPVGLTGIAADISAATTEADRAAAIVAALEADANFLAVLDAADSSNQTVIVEANFYGAVSTAAADVDASVTIVEQRSGLGGTLGRTTEDGVSLAFETTSVDILTDQTAQIPQDVVITGTTAECTFSLLEMTAERFKTVVGSFAGDSVLPSGGTEVTGFGTSRLYQSAFDLGGRLFLHPTRFDASDRSKDVTFPLSAPLPGSLNFSGSEPQALEVTFRALPDPTLDPKVNLVIFGDAEQDLRA